MEQLAYLVLFLFVCLALKLWWENNRENTKEGLHFKTGLIDIDVTTIDSEDENADPEFVEEVLGITSRRQLMEFIDDYNSLWGSENDEILRKALQFNLDPEDWADIYHIAEEGSELEAVAESKAGDALE